MTYSEALQYLYAATPAFHLVGAAAYKPGLDNTIRLMEHLGNPHQVLRCIHVAGTNGKGSTSHLIAACLQSAGLKVGLYTSPHLVDYRERIRINGQMIPEDRVVQFVEEHHAFLEELRPSFFETTMALAFTYFAEQQVDIAVVEVGLGGRLDSTNIITPILSVITNIGFDHEEFLGNTLPQIATEKAGIIKPNVPCVIGETNPETAPVFIAKAKECGIWGDGPETTSCRIWFADQCTYLRNLRQRIAPDCELRGIYQDHNLQTAFVALMALNSLHSDPDDRDPKKTAEGAGGTLCDLGRSVFVGLLSPEPLSDCEPCTEEQPCIVHCEPCIKEQPCIVHCAPCTIKAGFAKVCTLTGLRGRWEILSHQPLTICDTGHNSHGIQYVATQLQQLLTPHRALCIVNREPSSCIVHCAPCTEEQPCTDKQPCIKEQPCIVHREPCTEEQPCTDKTLHLIIGMVSDKDYDRVLSLLPVEHTRYYFCQPATHRALPATELLAMWQQLHPNHTAYAAYPTTIAALQAAQSAAAPTDIIFIGGSNYVVGEILPLFHVELS